MADSNITKRALATSLKALMSQRPFTKISVGDICEGCAMNRKSFYYHFRDKYDLVNWIFDKEFVAVARLKPYDSAWEQFADLCEYLYKNKEFYRQAFKIDGQNSFSETSMQYCREMLVKDMPSTAPDVKADRFQEELMSLMFKNAVELWLSDNDGISAAEFSDTFKNCVLSIATRIIKY